MRDHPELKGRTLFIDAGATRWKDVEASLAHLDFDEDSIEEIRETYAIARRHGTSFHQEIEPDADRSIGVIVYHPDKQPVFSAKKGAIDDAGSFDHETGHALSPEAKGTLGENTADAYALIRQFQRFAGRAEDADAAYCGFKRAFVFMTAGTTSHLTSFTADKIAIDARAADFSTLSPEETRALARKYAKGNTPTKAELKKLRDDFAPLKGRKPTKATFRKMAEITLKADTNSRSFYLGARVLSEALREDGVVIDGRKITLKGREWDALRHRLEARKAQLPARHPLRKL